MLLDELSDTMLEEVIAYMSRLIRENEEDDMEYCQSYYDEAKAGDDGYRVSAGDLRVKYRL